MKKIYRKFLIVISVLFICCSTDENNNEQEQIDSALLELSDSSYYIVEELNERGLLKTSFFSNTHEGIDKVLEGSDDTFNYLCYGEFIFLDNQNIHVPKNIKHVTQIDPKTQEILNIDLDENYFPIRFEPKLQGKGLIYTIEYGANQTIVRIEEMQTGGTPTLVKEILFPGINREIDTTGKISSKSKNDDDCKKSIEENMAAFNICEEGNVYEEFGDNFENYTEDTWVSSVGQFVNFLVKEMKTLSCNESRENKSSEYGQSKISFCSQLKESRQNYIKLLNTGEVFGVYGDKDNLQSYQTLGPVWSAGLYSLNTETPTEWPFLNKYFTSYSMEHCHSEDCLLVIHPQHPYKFSRMSMNLAYKIISDVRQVDVSAIYSMEFITKAGTIWNGTYSDSWGIGYHMTGMSSAGPFELHNYDGGIGIN